MNRYQQMAEVQKNWTAPRELGHSIPRAVSLSGKGIALAVLAGALALGSIVAGVLLARESRRQTGEIARFEQQGTDVDARIVRLRRTGDQGNDYRVKYWFRFGGRTYEKDVKVPQRIWKKLAEGGTMPVRFLAANPALNHPHAVNKSAMSIWVAILVPAFLIALGLVCGAFLRRQMHLLAEGRPAPAVVTKVRKVESEGGHTTIVEYEFPMQSGGIGKGKYESSAKGIGLGSTLTILYNPDNPRRIARYPMCLVRVDRS